MLLTEKYSEQIFGVISCYDRIVIQGTLQPFCYADGMTMFLKSNGIRIFDYQKFAEPLRNELRNNAEKIAKDNHVEIEFVTNKVRKEALISKIVEKRGNHPGIVHIISAMETCNSYKPWHDKKTHRTYLQPTQGKCLHYYFYFIDELMGLCYVRVPTWCPFRLQIYFNGHNILGAKLQNQNIDYVLQDNAFLSIDDISAAQELSNQFDTTQLFEKLNQFAERYCPIINKYNLQYHFSIMQAEYATDIIFKTQQDLHHLYDNLVRTAIHTVKPENIATFLGKKLHFNYQDDMGNKYNIRIEGTRIKHTMGPVNIKMYDKFGKILRIETTVNDVSFFKHYRTVEHRDGSQSQKIAPIKKSIFSLAPLTELLKSSNNQYIQFISSFDNNVDGVEKLNIITNRVVENNRPYKGFNFFDDDDQRILEAVAAGEFNISGFQNKDLRTKLSEKTSGQVSRILKRLHMHGLIKKIAHSYKYYISKLGRQVILLGMKLKELVIIPELAKAA